MRAEHQVLTALAAAAAPLLAGYVAYRQTCSGRPLVGAMEKWHGRIPEVEPGRILVHGVSLGETALMRPLVPLLERDLGPCVVSTSTETGWQGLAKAFPQHPRVFWPFDLPWAVSAFLERLQPRAVVLLESEFWPVMTMACQARGIPLVVANARLSERSHARLQQVGPLRRLLAGYAGAAAQNEEHAARLQSLGMPKVAVTGTMKADLVRPVSPEAARAEAQRIGLRSDRPLLLLASTSPDEEAVILDRERLAWWRAAGWQVAIAPRHPERGPALAALARSWGGSPCLTASPACPSPTPDHLPIINEIGRLGALYGLAALSGGIAVVGGSLGSGRGGQNMLEAAAHGCATVVGWDVRNQPDAMALLRAADGVVEVHAGAVHPRLQELAQDLPTRRALGDAGRNAWTAGLGAADRTAAHLDALLG